MKHRTLGAHQPQLGSVDRVGVYLPASVVFPDNPTDFDSFCSVVRTLSRTDTLFWCARINLLLSNPKAGNQTDLQRWVLRRFFLPDQIHAVEMFARAHGGAGGVRVFSRAQLLELFRWTCLLGRDQPEDGETFEDPIVRQRFVRAALTAADVWSARTYRDGLPATGELKADRQAAVQAFRRALGDNASGLDLERALARGTAVHERFTEYDAAFHADFRGTTGLTLRDYLACVWTIRVHYGNVTLVNVDEQPGIFVLDKVAGEIPATAAAAIRRFLELASQSPDTLATVFSPGGRLPTVHDRFDHKPLRERPILKTTDGRAIIIDPRYFDDLAVLGPTFHLAQAHRAEGSRVNQLFTGFGNSFEAYATGLLERISARADQSWQSPKRRTADGNVEVADAALRFGPDLLLFEAKAVFVRDSEVQAADVESYLNALREKYVVAGRRAGTQRAKGVGQLARAARSISEAAMLMREGDLADVARLFPVLLVYDHLLEAPGHAEFLGDSFASALAGQPTNAEGFVPLGSFLVAPLVVMTIDELEDLETSTEHFALSEFLLDYCQQGTRGARPTLAEFMAARQDRYPIRRSEELVRRAVAALDDAEGFLAAPAPTRQVTESHQKRRRKRRRK